jgi:hypothetical protein
VLEDIYRTNVAQRPVDTINVNRYEWDSERIIKDICWLNYFNEAHLSQCPGWEPLVADLPFSGGVHNGVCFALSSHPEEVDPFVLRRLRLHFAPIISDRVPGVTVSA